ncbi:unnamed protein product [Cochlearia groenlandica]
MNQFHKLLLHYQKERRNLAKTLVSYWLVMMIRHGDLCLKILWCLKTLFVDIVHSLDKKVQEEYNEYTSIAVIGPPVKDIQESITAGEEAILQRKAIEKMKDNNELSSHCCSF